MGIAHATPDKRDDEIRYINSLHARLGPLDDDTRRIRQHIASPLPSAYSPENLRLDADGDLTKVRGVPGDRVLRIVKSFPTQDGVTRALAGLATGIDYREFPNERSWCVSYRTAAPPPRTPRGQNPGDCGDK